MFKEKRRATNTFVLRTAMNNYFETLKRDKDAAISQLGRKKYYTIIDKYIDKKVNGNLPPIETGHIGHIHTKKGEFIIYEQIFDIKIPPVGTDKYISLDELGILLVDKSMDVIADIIESKQNKLYKVQFTNTAVSEKLSTGEGNIIFTGSTREPKKICRGVSIYEDDEYKIVKKQEEKELDSIIQSQEKLDQPITVHSAITDRDYQLNKKDKIKLTIPYGRFINNYYQNLDKYLNEIDEENEQVESLLLKVKIGFSKREQIENYDIYKKHKEDIHDYSLIFYDFEKLYETYKYRVNCLEACIAFIEYNKKLELLEDPELFKEKCDLYKGLEIKDLYDFDCRIVIFEENKIIFDNCKKEKLYILDLINSEKKKHITLVKNKIKYLCHKEIITDSQQKKVCMKCLSLHSKKKMSLEYFTGLKCTLCNKKFMNEDCYIAHKCNEFDSKCLKKYDCKYCGKKQVYKNHRCIIHNKGLEMKLKYDIYGYDEETTFDKDLNHKIQIVCVGNVLNLDEEIMTFTEDEFIEFIKTRTRPTFLFAHNAKGYDTVLLAEKLIHSHNKLGVIKTGSKLMEMSIDDQTYLRDSMMFIFGKLAKFSKNFGIKSIKLPFNYKLLHQDIYFSDYYQEDKEYIEFINSIEERIKENSSIIKYLETNKDYTVKALKKQVVWHGKIWNYLDNFHNRIKVKEVCINGLEENKQLEMYLTKIKKCENIDEICKLYCIADVELLRRGMSKYREVFLQQNPGCDPFTCVTLSNYCYRLFLNKYLKHKIYNLTLKEYEFLKKTYTGGRTCAFKFCLAVGLLLQYIDINSMYPFIMAYFKMPIGEPEMVYVDSCNKEDIDEVFEYLQGKEGFMCCDIKCPRGCYIPVLLQRSENKLIDSHNDIIGGCYCLPEIRLALTMGYSVVKIHYCCIYAESDYIFKDYIIPNYELKKKASADGNDVVALSAKIKINSLSGKFGQKINIKKNVLYEASDRRFERLFSNPDIDVEEVDLMGGKKYAAFCRNNSYTMGDIYLKNPYNVGIVSYITSLARCYLFKCMLLFGLRNIYYCDTDSLIVCMSEEECVRRLKFVGQMEVDGIKINKSRDLLGLELGQFKFEMKNINEYYACGPKSYYLNNGREEICKFKGFTNKKLDKSVYKRILDGEIYTEKVNMFVRGKNFGGIKTEERFKSTAFDCSKRKLDGNDSLPHGYCEEPWKGFTVEL